MALLVDESSGLVTDDAAGQPFFDSTGTPAEPLAQVITFFRTRARSAQATRTACAGLHSAGLLAPLPALPGMEPADTEGLLGLDTESFDALEAGALPALWDSGALRLAQAHRVSLFHAGWMARAQRAAAGQATPAPAAAEQPDAALSGFLDALSDAQDQDWGPSS
jgi:hypothetical protein